MNIYLSTFSHHTRTIQVAILTKSTTISTTIVTTQHFIQICALFDDSIFSTAFRCLFASMVSVLALSTLQSILSSIDPYSITKTDKSLNIDAKSLIDFTKWLISSSLYLVVILSSCSSIQSWKNLSSRLFFLFSYSVSPQNSLTLM